jgi:hypothetical protein
MDLYEEMQSLIQLLQRSIESLRKTGSAYAEAERAYKVKLREEVLKMRDEGMAVGIINTTIYGVPSVAELRFKRDVAKATYDANMEAIASYKLQIRILDAQIQREWGANG